MNKVEMLIYALDQMKSSHSAVGVEFNGSSDAFDEFYGIKTPTQMKAFLKVIRWHVDWIQLNANMVVTHMLLM